MPCRIQPRRIPSRQPDEQRCRVAIQTRIRSLCYAAEGALHQLPLEEMLCDPSIGRSDARIQRNRSNWDWDQPTQPSICSPECAR